MPGITQPLHCRDGVQIRVCLTEALNRAASFSLINQQGRSVRSMRFPDKPCCVHLEYNLSTSPMYEKTTTLLISVLSALTSHFSTLRKGFSGICMPKCTKIMSTCYLVTRIYCRVRGGILTHPIWGYLKATVFLSICGFYFLNFYFFLERNNSSNSLVRDTWHGLIGVG